MKLDVSSLGHRWKGVYIAGNTYSKGDVVRVGDDAKVVGADGLLTDFAQGQQSVELKSEILTNTNTPVVGAAGFVLQSATVGGTIQPQFKPTGERNGTKAVSLVTGGIGNRGQMKYGADGGGYHAGAVMTDGTLRVWGRRRYGETGLGDVGDVSRGIPTQAAFPPGTFIVKAWKCVNHMFAVDKDGQLWGTGYRFSGHGADSQRNTFINISQISDIKNDKIVDVTSSYDWQGYNQIFAIGESGRVYAWGYNQYGSLGLGDTNNRFTPTVVPFTKTTPIARVYAMSGNYAASYFIDTEGYMWGCGYGADNLVNPSTIYTHQKNVNMHGGVGVRHIGSHESAGHWSGAGGYYRSYAITMNNGDLLVVPMSTGGQVGWFSVPNSSSGYVGLDEVTKTGVRMCAVKNGGYDQAVALMLNGTVHGVGYSPLSGTNSNTSTWTQYPTITNAIDMVGAGSRHGQTIAILTSDGYIYDLGYNEGDGAGNQSSNPTSPQKVAHTRPFVQVAKYGFQYDGVNNHGTYALDDKGDVYVWGAAAGYETTDPNDAENAYVPTQVKF